MLEEPLRVARLRPSPFPEKYSLLPYYRLLNDMLEIKNGHSWEYMRNTLLIVDEAQLSYTYNTFWNDLIKNIPDSLNNNLLILLLSSYGSPSAVAVPPQPGCSPVVLSTQRRISIRPLLHKNSLVGLYLLEKNLMIRSGDIARPLLAQASLSVCQRIPAIMFGSLPMGTLVQFNFCLSIWPTHQYALYLDMFCLI